MWKASLWKLVMSVSRFRRDRGDQQRVLAMKIRYALGAALSLAFISAAEAPVNFRTYHGAVRVDSDPLLTKAYQKALKRCVPEALSPPSGNANPNSLHYNSALRNCLYRYGYLDRGVYSYPARNIVDDIFDR